MARGERKPRGREVEQERESFGGRSITKPLEGAAAQEAQVCSRLCCRLARLSPPLEVSAAVWQGTARDGAAQGLARTPRQLPRGSHWNPAAWHRGTVQLCTCAGLAGHLPCRSGARAIVQLGPARALSSGPASSPPQQDSPEKGQQTPASPGLLWVDHSFLTLSLQVPTHFPCPNRWDSRDPAADGHNKMISCRL